MVWLNFARANLGYIASILFVVVIGFGLYFAGKEKAKTNFLQEQTQEFQDTTKAVNRGINEVRRANPNRDAYIALERLRSRQTSQ